MTACSTIRPSEPLTMNAEPRATIHGVDERVAVEELARGELFHRTLIERLPA